MAAAKTELARLGLTANEKRTRRRVVVLVLVSLVLFAVAVTRSGIVGPKRLDVDIGGRSVSIWPWAELVARRYAADAVATDDAELRSAIWYVSAQSYSNALRWMPWREDLYVDAIGAYMAAGMDPVALIYLTALVHRYGGPNTKPMDYTHRRIMSLYRSLAAHQRQQALALFGLAERIWQSDPQAGDFADIEEPLWALRLNEAPVLPGARPADSHTAIVSARRCLNESCAVNTYEVALRGRLRREQEPDGICCGVSVSDVDLVGTGYAIRDLEKQTPAAAALYLSRIAMKLYFVATIFEQL